MEIPEKHRELAELHKKGAVIQIRHQDGSDFWLATYNPLWQEDREYRVAPSLTDSERDYLKRMQKGEEDAEAALRTEIIHEMARKDRLLEKVATQRHAKVGQIIAFSTGEYSDYQVKCHMRVLAEFATVDQILEYRTTKEYKSRYDSSDPDQFIAWLQAKGLIEPVEADEVLEWWLGIGYDVEI